MIFDLQHLPKERSICRHCDICILGAGTAGIFLAQSLRDAGLKIIVIELGGASSSEAKLSFEEPTCSNSVYHGAALGRVSGLGGTSTKWGGQMIGLSQSDFNLHEGLKDGFVWPITKDELKPYYERVARTLGFHHSRFPSSSLAPFRLFSKSFANKLFRIRVSTWLPFRKRNFASAFRNVIKKSPDLHIWINARLSSVNEAVWENEKLTQLKFMGPENQSLLVTGDHFVFTMGAIESTKYVTKLMGATDSLGSVGKPFCDHISSSAGILRLKDRAKFFKNFAPFFVKGNMKTIRFEFRYESQIANQTPSAFVHFVSRQQEGSALAILRNLARRMQGEPVRVNLNKVHPWTFMKDMVSIIFWRVFKGKLILNLGEEIEVVVDIEQRPGSNNRIMVYEENLELRWGINDEDLHTTSTVAHYFMDTWNSSPELAKIGTIVLNKTHDHTNHYDVYHPTGSLPFGSNPDESFLDTNLRVWDTSNVYVSSTAVFPTGGSANPGFTHLALTQRLSDHLRSKSRKTSAPKNN